MSGAEALLGIVAGGAGLLSLGIQLGEVALKLRRIYHKVKDAPQTVANLAFSLETMAIALRELEEYRHENSTGVILDRCILECQRGVAEAQRLTNVMEDRLARHPKLGGKVYAAFRDRDINALLDDLEKAKSSLELTYMIALAQEQKRRDRAHYSLLELQQASINNLREQVLVTSSKVVPLADQAQSLPVRQRHPRGSKQPTRRNSGEQFRARFRLPLWICRQVWDFGVTKAQSCWSFHLRTYNIVPDNSPIFRYCANGDITRVRELIESGEATPLDVELDEYTSGWAVGGCWTLLEIAAQCGQLEVCRYLLGLTTWPDHAAVLSNALGWFAYSNFKSFAPEMYRIFLGSSEFEFDLDGEYHYRWLHYCRNAECLDVILHTQFSGFDSYPLEARFELVSRVPFLKAAELLSCLGIRASDMRLATLKNSQHATPLHSVARRLWNLAYNRFSQEDTQEWVELGVSVLNSGADPSAIADQDDDSWLSYLPGPVLLVQQNLSRKTPLMDCLDIPEWIIHRDSMVWYHMILKTLRIWVKMIQNAGIDLMEYGAKESDAWESLGINNTIISDNYGKATVTQLVYGSEPDDWSLRSCSSWTVPRYILQPPPGAFPGDGRQPKQISWRPTKKEETEGPWKLVDEVVKLGKEVDLRESLSHPTEHFIHLLDGPQDDHGPIASLQYRASRSATTAPRSHSQPPLLRQREMAYYGARQSQARLWLSAYHLCPFDSRWRCGCVGEAQVRRRGLAEEEENYDCDLRLKDNSTWTTFHVRSCVEGTFAGRGSVQESIYWESQSFLAYATNCQDKCNLNWLREEPELLRHTGTRDCPQGCSRINMSRLNVPAPLWSTHPCRQYEDVNS